MTKPVSGASAARPEVSRRSPVSGPYKVQVLDRTLQILDLLAQADTDLGPSELGTALSLHRSTTHRLLQVLERHQFIRKSTVEGKYALGMKLFQLGCRVVAHVDLASRANPYLRQLVEATGETAHICVLNGTEMVSIANVEGPWTLRTPATIGRRTQLHCTAVGKAYMAHMPEAEQRDLLSRLTLPRFTKRTLVTRATLASELQRVRERGWAMDNEEIEEGLRCLGAAVHNHSGAVVAAISVAGPVFRVTKQRLPGLVRSVISIAQALSRDIGYQAPSRKGSATVRR